MVEEAVLVCRVAKVKWPVSAMRSAKRIGEGMRVGMDFALIHKTLLVIVKKLHGVLDRDHVLFTLVIDFVEHGSQRGRFTGACRAGHKDESARLVAQSLHDERQSQSVKAFDFPWNRTEDRANGAPLIENVAAESGQVLQTK